MPGASDLDVAYVASLVRLRLTKEEATLFQTQLAEVLEHAESLRGVDVSGVETSAHAIPMSNVFRADEARSGFTAEEALQNAPQQANGLFIVPKVVG